jgi:hypothetical protein
VAERFIRELYGRASASEKSAELTLFHGFDVFSEHQCGRSPLLACCFGVDVTNVHFPFQ